MESKRLNFDKYKNNSLFKCFRSNDESLLFCEVSLHLWITNIGKTFLIIKTIPNPQTSKYVAVLDRHLNEQNFHIQYVMESLQFSVLAYFFIQTLQYTLLLINLQTKSILFNEFISTSFVLYTLGYIRYRQSQYQQFEYLQNMGSSGSRVIQIDDLENRLQECVRIKDANSDIYGEVHYVSFQGMPFYLGESQTSEIPHPMSLHYLVKPNLLLFPQFTLLQDIGPDDFYQLLSIIKGISQMVIQGGQVGFGKNRIGYNARWGVVGQKNVYWSYYQILVQNNPEGVFLSPQLMIALSQQKQTPKVNFQKADIFAFGIMLIQIIFQEKLDHIYDFQNFQIYLNPLLQKITMVKANFGEQFAQILVSMLQIQQENRLNFSELLENIEQLMSEYSINMIGSNNSQRAALQYSRGNNRTPTKGPSIYSQKTPKNNGGNYRNDVSPFRGRFGSNVRPNQRSGRTPERVNKSPMRKDLRINTKLDKQNNQYNARIGFTDYGKAARLSPLMRR